MNGATEILAFEVIKDFQIRHTRTMSIAFRMTRCRSELLPAHAPPINSSLTLKPRESST